MTAMIKTNPEDNSIELRGPIGDFDGGISYQELRDALDQCNGDITIKLDSPGGSVTEGLAMYNALMEHDGKVTVHIDVLAASIASVIMCAADSILINSNAKVMVHRCWTVAAGNCTEFRSMADIMEMLDDDIAFIYSERCDKLNKKEWLDVMTKETWFTADDAVELGICDAVVPVKRKRSADKPAENRSVLAIAPLAFSLKAAAKAKRMRLRIDG